MNRLIDWLIDWLWSMKMFIDQPSHEHDTYEHVPMHNCRWSTTHMNMFSVHSDVTSIGATAMSISATVTSIGATENATEECSGENRIFLRCFSFQLSLKVLIGGMFWLVNDPITHCMKYFNNKWRHLYRAANFLKYWWRRLSCTESKICFYIAQS